MEHVDGQVSETWRDLVARKRQLQTEEIAAFASKEEDGGNINEITHVADAADLVSMISRGDVTSVAVVKAYIKK